MKKIVLAIAVIGTLFATSCSGTRDTVKADPEETGYPAQPMNSAQPQADGLR